MPDLPIDLASVDWAHVIILAVIAFVGAVVGNAIAFGNKLFGALLTAVFFAVFYVLWVYWLQAMVMGSAATTPPI